MSQNEQILMHMRNHKGTITNHEAIEMGCYRLAARIGDLRSAGHKIVTEIKRYEYEGKHYQYAEYHLIEEGI